MAVTFRNRLGAIGLGAIALAATGFLGLCAGSGVALVASDALAAEPSAAASAPPGAEESEVRSLPPLSTDWFFIRARFNSDGSAIHDATTGKMVGLVNTSRWSDLAFDPARKAYYVSETIWSKGNRGTRQDMVSVYDATSLKLQAEIPLPGRLIIGAQLNNFAISPDGKTGYVYNLTPASSLLLVDLAKRKFVREVDLPGCAGLMPIDTGVVALCSDGSLASLELGACQGKAKAPVDKITRSEVFFAPTTDPIFDSFAYSVPRREAVMISYTGQIYTAKISAKPSVAAPFSIQQAAGLRAGSGAPLDINWFPGGFQPLAWHRASNHAYVLMHKGEYWTQKEAGTEIWDVDLTAKKVVKRFKLPEEAGIIEVTQSAHPRIIVLDGKENGWLIDPANWSEAGKITRAGGGVILSYEPAGATP